MNSRLVIWFVGVFVATIFGCVGAGTPFNVVPEAEGAQPISGFKISCSSPVELTQGCSLLYGPNQTIVIWGTEISIAGSADGETVFIRDTSNSSLSSAGDSVEDWASAANLRFDLVKQELLKRDIRVQHAAPVSVRGVIVMYMIVFDGDAYSVLEEYKKAE